MSQRDRGGRRRGTRDPSTVDNLEALDDAVRFGAWSRCCGSRREVSWDGGAWDELSASSRTGSFVVNRDLVRVRSGGATRWRMSASIIPIGKDLLGALTVPSVALGAFGPAVGAFYCLRTLRGKGAIRQYLRGLLDLRFGWWGWFAPPLVLGGTTWLAWILPELWGEPRLPMLLPSVWVFLPVLLLMVFVGGGQEELGWRGYILDPLEERLGPWLGNIVLGVVWSVWHLPLFFVQGTTQRFMPFLGFTLYLTRHCRFCSNTRRTTSSSPRDSASRTSGRSLPLTPSLKESVLAHLEERYSVYNYTYYVLGAALNVFFAVYVLAFVVSAASLILGLVGRRGESREGLLGQHCSADHWRLLRPLCSGPFGGLAGHVGRVRVRGSPDTARDRGLPPCCCPRHDSHGSSPDDRRGTPVATQAMGLCHCSGSGHPGVAVSAGPISELRGRYQPRSRCRPGGTPDLGHALGAHLRGYGLVGACMRCA